MNNVLEQIITPYYRQRESLILVLQKVQAAFGFIPAEAISEIANYLSLSESEIYGVASFYAFFRFERQGEHTVRICQGTACHVRGGRRILDAVERDLGIHCGETTENFKFSLERVACFGACALAPVMVIDKTVNGKITTSSAKKILDSYSKIT
jgi:NADH-quinone oxidoreductase subunit E